MFGGNAAILVTYSPPVFLIVTIIIVTFVNNIIIDVGFKGKSSTS